MANYAFIDTQKIVVQVISGIDEDVTQQDLDGSIVGGSSQAWEEFYASRSWFEGLTCKRTSYNTSGGVHSRGQIPFRKNYAGIGYSYDETRDAFIPPKPFPSWTLDETTCLWVAPKPLLNNGKHYLWNEEKLDWVEIDPQP